MNDTYECSYVEVLEILKHIPKEEYDKIPKQLIEFFEEHKDKSYQYIYNAASSKTLRKTDAIIVSLYKDYIATDNEKKQIEKRLMENFEKSENEKRKQYNPDDLFKKNKIKVNTKNSS